MSSLQAETVSELYNFNTRADAESDMVDLQTPGAAELVASASPSALATLSIKYSNTPN